MESGTRLGPYVVQEQLGAGGMGEVWQARDTDLARDVALKVLPAGLADDAERMARFEQEARSLAALNHPNIAQVYGLERGDVTVIVMELVEGEDLAARLHQGPLELDEILLIARQITEALEAAHEAGIVHRDLKPANIRVRPDGTAKVLDFGLAKSTEGAATPSGTADAPTIMSPAVTGAGVIMGTAAYMAPEQARGKTVDRRADVWAFGCVLFEMIAGQRAFGGDDVSMTLASVLKKDIDWSALPAATPVPLRRMIERCLEVEPRRRFQSIGDARVELEDWIDGGHAANAAVAGAGDVGGGPRPWGGITAGATLIALLAGAAGWFAKPAPEAPLRALLLDAESAAVQMDIADASDAVLLPGGAAVVTRATNEVWLRPLDGSEPRLLAQDAQAFALSPDGTEIIVDQRETLTRVSFATGNATAVSDMIFLAPYGMNWSPSGKVYFSKGGDLGIQSVDMTTGEITPVLRLAGGDTRFVTPWELPNGEIMFSMLSRGRIEVFDGTTRHVVYDVPGATVEDAMYTREGYVLWSQWDTDEGVWAAPYSQQSRTFTGPSRRIWPLAGSLSVSDNGLLVIAPHDARGASSAAVVVLDRSGNQLRELITPQPSLRTPRLGPGGRRLAVQRQSLRSGNSRIIVHDIDRNISVELGAGAPPGNIAFPEWIPDGSALLYVAGPVGDRALLLQDAAGAGTPTILVPGGVSNSQISVSGDGRIVTYAGNDGDIWYVETAGGDPQRFRETEDVEFLPALSPDGRFLVYSRSSLTGTDGLFVERFPEGGDAQPIETSGWDSPRWSHDGREIYYAGRAALMAARFDPASGRIVSSPEPLLPTPPLLGGFDVTPDGQFVLPRAPERDAGRRRLMPIVIQNWQRLLD